MERGESACAQSSASVVDSRLPSSRRVRNALTAHDSDDWEEDLQSAEKEGFDVAEEFLVQRIKHNLKKQQKTWRPRHQLDWSESDDAYEDSEEESSEMVIEEAEKEEEKEE